MKQSPKKAFDILSDIHLDTFLIIKIINKRVFVGTWL